MAVIEIDLDYFSDDEIVDECRKRGLARKVQSGLDVLSAPGAQDTAVLAYEAMLRHQPGTAAQAMWHLIECFLPAEILTAWHELKHGRVNAAIVALDHFIEPAPSATAKKLPVREPTSP